MLGGFLNQKYIFVLISFLFILILSIGCVSASDELLVSSSSPSLSDFASSDLSDEGYGLSHDYSIDLDSYSSSLESANSNDFDENSLEISNQLSSSNNLPISDSSNDSIKEKMESKTKSNKIETKIKANKINAYYKENARLNISLKDSNNQALKNKSVKIYINKKILIKRTDQNGKIGLLLNLNPGIYNVKIAFAGDDAFEKSSANTKVTIKKVPVAIKTSNFSTYFNSDIFFKAKVINNATKHPVEGIKVLFKVYSSKNKYKIYYSLTDKKGIATLNKNLKVGKYDVYTFLKDTGKGKHLVYRNLKNKAVLKVKETAEMGCSSIYVYVNENESALAFRRDSTYAAKLYIVSQKWHGKKAIKQYKLTGTYFFHSIVTSDGWLIGTGGWDNPKVNKKIENLAGKMVSSNSINSSTLKAIRKVESQLPTGHFAIVAPNGRYAVVWRGGYIKGKLKSGEYLDVPNLRSFFRKGKFKKFSSNPATAAHKIAATDIFGVNRRNIMVYHYKRTTKNYKTNSSVTVYGSNDRGNLIGRHTSHLIDNVLFKKMFISKDVLFGTPKKKLLGTHNFGNIDKLIKAKTEVTAPNVTGNFNESKYFKVTLRNNNTKKLLKGVKVNLRVYTGSNYTNYVLKTDKNGRILFNIKQLAAGTHKVLVSPANHKYIISAKSSIVINAINNANISEGSNDSNINDTDSSLIL